MLERLTRVEAKLDQVIDAVGKPKSAPQTAVEWFAYQMKDHDYGYSDDRYEIRMSYDKFQEIYEKALDMEVYQNDK
jgi:hypothetical protein